MCSWAQEEIWKISSSVPIPPGKAMKASTCLNIVFSRSDIVETCSSSPIVFPRRSFFAKTLGTAPKSWLPDCLLKMQLLTHPLLTQGCLRHTLNEYFSQLIPNQDDLLILKTHFLSQDWIHWKHKYFLFEDLRNQPFSTHFDICWMCGLSRNEGKEEKML